MNTYADNVSTLRPATDVAITAPIAGDASASAVSWGAILAGAAAAAAFSLILLMLGTGLSLSAVSPWLHDGISARSFGVSTILWVTFTSIVASALGGYIAGRLRTRWISVHSDEVYFRDTAHGFLAWAVASLLTAALLTSTIGSILNAGVQAGATVASGVATGTAAPVSAQLGKTDADGGMSYFVDYLFRGAPAASLPVVDAPSAEAIAGAGNERGSQRATRAEVTAILARDLAQQTLPTEDLQYLGRIVATRTGLTQAEAELRVSQTYARVQEGLRSAESAAKVAADKARKASAVAALWLFISLLIGAFVASLSATYGGRQRDN
jgi:hypothetical protein